MKKKKEMPLPETKPVPAPPAEAGTETTNGKARSGRFWTAVDWLWKHRWAAAVVVFAVVFLSVVNYASRGRMNRYTASERELACARVMPEASAFSETPYTHELANSIYAGYSGSTLMGYCVEVTVDGFGGDMTLMVGVNTDGAVTGAAIEFHHDDPDWADEAGSEAYMAQYIGRSGKIADSTVNGITGATETSRAVTDGVNRALKVMSEVDTKGGTVLVEEGEN